MAVKKIKKKIVKKVFGEKDLQEKIDKIELEKQSKPEKSTKTTMGILRYAEYLIFINWMSLPKEERWPETHQEFAEKFGLCKDTLTGWKKKPEFWDEVRNTIRRNASEDTGAVVKKLKSVSLSGDVQAIRTYLQYTGDLVEKKENNLGATPELMEALDKMRKVLPD